MYASMLLYFFIVNKYNLKKNKLISWLRHNIVSCHRCASALLPIIILQSLHCIIKLKFDIINNFHKWHR